jgi:membrane protease YdiL (CAAX protease family)
MLINTFFIDIFAGLVLLYFVIVKYRERLASMGLKFSSFFKDILSGITTYIFIAPLLLVILFLSILLLDFLGYTPPPQPVFEVFMEEKRSDVLLFLTIFVAVFGPIAEEMFFRGFMYSAIKKRLGVLTAALLSAAIFSSLHTNIVGFLPIMTLGVLLAYLYETTGSLVASMTVHIVHNSIMVGFVFFIKELMS